MARPLRVLVQQMALPRYRLPIFAELARRPGIDLTVRHAAVSEFPSGQEAAIPFQTQVGGVSRLRLFGRERARWLHGGVRDALAGPWDVLLMDANLRYANLIPTLLAARAKGRGTVLWHHGVLPGHNAPPSPRLRRLLDPLARAWLFYGERAIRVHEQWGWPPEKLFFARNCLDTTPMSAVAATWSVERLRDFRNRRGISDRRLILFIARLTPERRLDQLLHALARTPNGTALAVIGSGPAEPGLRHQVQDMGLGDRVLFLGALYEEEELAPWFLSADFACFPAHVGLSLVHAFAYGCPVVAGMEHSGPELEYLQDGVNGVLLPSSDQVALHEAMAQLWARPDTLQRMGQAAQNTARTELSVSGMVDGMERALRFADPRASP